MAIYGDFSEPEKFENITIDGETKNPLLFGIFGRDLVGTIGKKKITISYRDIIPNIGKYMFWKYFPNSEEAIILNDYVYLPDFSKSKMEDISKKMIDSYESDNLQLEQYQKKLLRNIIHFKFVQYMKEQGSVLGNPDDTDLINYMEKDKKNLLSSSGTGGFWTSFHESLNFIYFIYRMKNYNITFFEYILGLTVPEYGDKIGIQKEDYKLIKITNSNISTSLYENSKIILPFIVLQYRKNKERKWYDSTLLTFQQIQNSQIFEEQVKYKFYGEKSIIYYSIFEKIKSIISRNSKLFSSYLRELNTNKYFISDFLVVQNTSKGAKAIKDIKDYILFFSRNPSIESLSNLFEFMDKCFLSKAVIPISLKQIKAPSKTKIDEIFIQENKSINNYVVVINRPKSEEYKKSSFSNIKLDDFDKYLFNLMGTNSLDEQIDKTFFIDKFKYPLKTVEMEFKFRIKLNGEYKAYKFISKTSGISISKTSTASATGEGTINKYSLNYVLKEIYKGKFSQKLVKLSKNRNSQILLKDPNNKKDEIIRSYIKAISKNEILTNNQEDPAFKVLKDCLINKKNSVCIEHFLSYYNKLLKKSEQQILNKDDLVKKLSNICSKEIGIILDAEVDVEPDLKVNIINFDRKKIILSEWALITARGPIEFEGNKFKNAEELKEITKYQIKFPALVKIGI